MYAFFDKDKILLHVIKILDDIVVYDTSWYGCGHVR